MAKLRIVMVAGEASGDILGAGLIRALKQHYPDAEFEGIGGDLMCAEGFNTHYPLESLSVMGLVEVLGKLRELLKIRADLIGRYLANAPDLFIGIDAPDFNLKIETALKAAGIPTVHYVSPSIWAWKAKRVFKIKKAADLVLALFPFESKYYAPTQQRVAFVGHPLADQIANDLSLINAKSGLGVENKKRVVALLPGSRAGELKYLAEPFLEAASLFQKKYPDTQFLLPAVNERRLLQLQQIVEQKYSALNITLSLKNSRLVMAASDAILIASGTATLEALLLKKPMVVCYKMASLTYAIYSRMLKTPFVALPNILANKALVPEILQNNVTAERLYDELEHIFSDQQYLSGLKEEFDQIAKGLTLNADERAAEAIVALLELKKGR